ncbi:MAG TPA: ATP synthase F1 subunit delta [Candidatus Saccharimonadales bacterium]|nr:ATP synthase F1 subunit delta [Candidatus Saccharimonadales bacterium]
MNSKLSRRVIARAFVAKLVNEPTRQAHWVKVLAGYLVEQQQIDTVDMLLADISREYFAKTGVLLADVTSARPLTAEVRRAVEKALHEATDAKKVVITERTDQSLIGGVVARTPDAVLDVSVRSQLNQLAAIK